MIPGVYLGNFWQITVDSTVICHPPPLCTASPAVCLRHWGSTLRWLGVPWGAHCATLHPLKDSSTSLLLKEQTRSLDCLDHAGIDSVPRHLAVPNAMIIGVSQLLIFKKKITSTKNGQKSLSRGKGKQSCMKKAFYRHSRGVFWVQKKVF